MIDSITDDRPRSSKACQVFLAIRRLLPCLLRPPSFKRQDQSRSGDCGTGTSTPVSTPPLSSPTASPALFLPVLKDASDLHQLLSFPLLVPDTGVRSHQQVSVDSSVARDQCRCARARDYGRWNDSQRARLGRAAGQPKVGQSSELLPPLHSLAALFGVFVGLLCLHSSTRRGSLHLFLGPSLLDQEDGK